MQMIRYNNSLYYLSKYKIWYKSLSNMFQEGYICGFTQARWDSSQTNEN